MKNPSGISNYLCQLALRKDERAVGADEPVLWELEMNGLQLTDDMRALVSSVMLTVK
jgi:hypothetical protein